MPVNSKLPSWKVAKPVNQLVEGIFPPASFASTLFPFIMPNGGFSVEKQKLMHSARKHTVNHNAAAK